MKLEEILPEVRKGRRAWRKDVLMTNLSPGDKFYNDLDSEDLLADDWELGPEKKKYSKKVYLWSDGSVTAYSKGRWDDKSVRLIETRTIEWEVEG